MKYVMIVIYVLLAIIALILIASVLMRKQHRAQAEITINTSADSLYNFLRFIDNQDKFNKWAKSDPNRVVTPKGTDGTIGYVYAWKGKEAGEGEKIITDLVENKVVESEIHFVKPMKTSAKMRMELEELGPQQTRVTFTNSGELSIPFNVLIPVFESGFKKDMQSSLENLKTLMESH